jgi:hypothetical protein
MVEQLTHNPKFEGSYPAGASNGMTKWRENDRLPFKEESEF